MEPLPTNEFLKKLGFVGGNPFSETQAEEEDNLSKYFVDLPAFYKILDMDTGKPKSSILGADRGCGKSANRKNVERWLLQGPADKSSKGKWAWKSPVLVILYTDFGRIRASVNDDFSKLRPEHHVDSILWAGIACLIEYLDANWEKFQPHELSDWDLARLGYFLTHYSEQWGGKNDSNLSESVKKTQTSIDFFQTSILHASQAEKISLGGSSGLLKNFTEIVLALGFKSVVVLVDGVDEIDITANKPELSALLLKSLIAERVLMQMNGLTFKFFLPNQVIGFLEEIPETRLGERIKSHEIIWNEQAIQKLLSLRLGVFSNNRLNDLAQISTPDLKDISNALASHVANNPRNLLRLAEQVLIKSEENYKTSSVGDKNRPPRINKSILDEAVSFYDEHVAPNNAYVSTQDSMGVVTSKWRITPELHVMYKGKIITKEKLDPKEFQILELFLERPGERLERVEIGKAVWKDKWVDKYGWVLNQTILRLRKKIGRERIKTVRGIGYIFNAE
ncbi:MAG TPA: winged helix-turn-helix domain-containing protein [Anaerolineales bacterium]|nr:winged helix-turn-helix domain-containing protein [Anaerolineales bacterium]